MAIALRQVDVILCPFWATTTTAALRAALEGIAAQEGVNWRLVMVDGTKSSVAEEMARSIVPAGRLEYDRPVVSQGQILSNVQQGTLYWQAMLGSNARYVAYADSRGVSARAWRHDHLFMLSDILSRGRADFVFSGSARFDCDPDAVASIVASRNVVPLGTVMHRSAVYGRLGRGWDRHSPGDQEHQVWQEMALLRPRIRMYHFGMETAPALVRA